MSSPFITDAQQEMIPDLVEEIEDAIRGFFAPHQIDVAVSIRATLAVLALLAEDGEVDVDIFVAEVGAMLRAILTKQENPNGPRSSH